MANKKLQNNQNRKNTDGLTMNGNSTVPAASTQHAHQNPTGPSNSIQNNNNSSASSNAIGGTIPNSGTPTSAVTTNANYSQHNHSQNQHSHQRLSSTSSLSQHSNSSKQTIKKSLNNEVEKIHSSVGSQSNQGSFRGGGNKDQRTKEKEKERNTQNAGRQGNQPNHHHHTNHNTSGGGNQQNARKKDHKFQNRDLSNQSHRGGGFPNNHGNHYQPHHHHSNSVENSKTVFPSNTSLSSAGGIVSPTPAVPVVPQVFHESKTVQTEEKVKKEKPKLVKKEEEASSFKNTNPKDMDAVMAFQEQDDWNKVEMMCELLYLLSPTDLRLVLNCIEGAIRCYTNQMRPVEKTSNSSDPTECLPQYVCSPPNLALFAQGPDAASCSQRSVVNCLFANQPPGLSPLAPSLIIPVEQNYNLPSSSNTPSSSVSTSNKEAISEVTTNVTAGGNMPADGQSQDALRNSHKATTPEPEASVNTAHPSRPATTSTLHSTPPVPQEPEKFLKSVRDLTSYIYTLMSVCASTNRKSAAKISDYVKGVLLREKTQILERIPNELDKIDVLQDIGKIIAAMTHHPAVTLDDKMCYGEMRDGLRAEIESYFRQYYSKRNERKQDDVASTEGVGDTEDTEDSDDGEEDEFEFARRFGAFDLNSRALGHLAETHSAPGTFFITRFIGRAVEKNDNLFSLEIHWSDGDRTFAQRSREQLKALQHRLLDEFGQQRSEKNHHHGTASSLSSFDEDNKKLSASTSTMETSVAFGGDRIVPRLPWDAVSSHYVQYINELSDLPARMMLSSVICEEFNGTRARTEDLLQETRDSSDGLIFSRWKNPRAKSPIRYFQRNSAGVIDQIDFPVSIQPFLYSNTPQTQQQILYASCSNCGGQHNPKNCDKPTMLDKKAPEHKLRPDPEGTITAPTTQLGGAGANNFYPIHPQMAHHMFIEAPPGMIHSNHFNHHQQMMQNTLFHNGGQFRPNGPQYENHVPMMFLNPQNSIQNSSNSTVNNGSGASGNQNTNF